MGTSISDEAACVFAAQLYSSIGLGKGFLRSNLQNMRALYLAYPICQTLSGKLSWSHYCELLSISDADKRSFYEKETINFGLSNNIFASRYVSYIPNKEQLIAQVEAVLNEWNKGK